MLSEKTCNFNFFYDGQGVESRDSCKNTPRIVQPDLLNRGESGNKDAAINN